MRIQAPLYLSPPSTLHTMPMAGLNQGRGRLPPELVDMIIDHLYDDKVTLATCTLVAKSWLTASRLHLFYEITVFHDRSSQPFGKFAAFLSNKPTLRPLIKTICMNGYHTSDQRQGRLDAAMLDGIISQLPTLETLLIVNCYWDAHKGDGARRTPPPVPQYRAVLRNLYISYFSAEHETTLAKLEVLRHFKKVERLQLDHVWLGHFEDDEGEEEDDVEPEHSAEVSTGRPTGLKPRVPRIHPEVTSLVLSMADICLNFLAHLWRQPFLGTIKAFTVQDFFQAPYLTDHQDLMFVGDVIRDTLRAQLTQFELDLPRLRSNGQSLRISSAYDR